MSEKVPEIAQGTHRLEDAATLFIGKTVYEGWEDLKVTRELNSVASDFQLQIVDKWRVDQEPWRLVPGELAHVHLGKQSIITGYIDKVEASVDKSRRSVTVSGRSKTADLVDCSVIGENQFSGLTIKEIAEKLCEPFGIKVTLNGNAGAVFPSIVVQQSETVFALLDRLARERKLLMYPTHEGNLVISEKGTLRASNEIRQGVNYLSGKSTFDYSNRFSKYVIKGQNLGFLGTAEQSTSPMGEATDEGVSRYRPLLIVAENTVDGESSADRANYEAELRAAKALTAEVQVQGWFQSDGKLWDINQIVFVDAGFLGIRRRMLIQKVEFNKSNAGTTTSISLIREDAYGFKKKIKKEDPLGWTKFTK